jgi:uncharacterized MnhB-related membrane protein
MVASTLVLLTLVCGAMAVRARRLLASALWLAGASAVLSVFLYQLGAPQVAVIELSVGAGLVTVLFVFAINVAGDEAVEGTSVVPRGLAWALTLAPLLILAVGLLPAVAGGGVAVEEPFVNVLWQDRALDVVVQVVLIFAGVLGLLGLLAEAEAPLRGPAAREVAARRERDLRALEQTAEREEVEA